MKTFDQLAESAYLAYQKAAQISDEQTPAFSALSDKRKACWLAVAKQLVAEIAALH